ncbi:hypothetical protein [Streptomyces sp. AD55]|uniref:hypothetical protein n=1 Tax=Streptomyces sp. AD55 TaxID=3242895 RepID=UPI0035291A3A
MALNPYSVHDLAEAVLGCVCAALDAVADQVEGQPGCPARACVVPGAPAWDDCDAPCDGPGAPGQLTVHVHRLYPSTRFPVEDIEVRGTPGCSPPAKTAAELVVTLLRCAPVPTENGCPPPCEELSEAARILHTDSTTLYNALLCCLPQTGTGNRRRGPQFVLGGQRTIGPQGGCVGIEQRVIVALPGCSPCPGDRP